jgi:hypothetical protein
MLQQIWDQIGPQVIELGVIALGAAIIYAKSGLRAWVTGHTEAGKKQSALLLLNDVAFTLVLEAMPEVEQIKKMLADGKATRAEADELLAGIKKRVVAKALSLLKSHLVDGLGILADAASDLVAAKVEAAVPGAKAALAGAAVP